MLGRQKSSSDKVSSSETGQGKQPWRALWIVFAAIFLIFLVYEIIERTWLADADPKLLFFLHIIRGVGTSIIAALLVIGYVLRAHPPIFPSESTHDDGPFTEEDLAENQLIRFNNWIVRMRWLASFIAAILIMIVIKFLNYLEDDLFLPLMLLVGALVVANLIFGQLVRRRFLTARLLEMQIGFDLVILTAMLHFSGGIENSLFLVYMLHVIIGGIFLSRLKCYGIVVLIAVLFGGLVFCEMVDLLPHYTLRVFPHGDEKGNLFHAAHDHIYVVSFLTLQLAVMSLTAFFITTIMGQLRAEEGERQAAHQRLGQVVQATGAGFAILSESLRPVWMNSQIRSWLNLDASSEDDMPQHLEEWFGGPDGPEAETFRDGKVRIETRRVADADGNDRFLQVTVSPLKNRSGDVYEVVQLTQDITEQKIVEAEMIQAEKMMVLGTMAAGIAHEVGNPLASISTRLSLLEETGDEELIKESLGVFQEQISRITRIVHGVSSFARPDEMEKTLCQINVPVSEALDILRLHRLSKVVTITTRLAPGLPEINAVKDHLVQVFVNLGLNALEAIPDGGRLTVRTYLENGHIHIAVEDTGSGIPEHLRPRVFDTFFSTKKSGTGMGMGLSIASNIVKNHGGRFEVRDNPGGGTIFEVILPVQMQSSTLAQSGETHS